MYCVLQMLFLCVCVSAFCSRSLSIYVWGCFPPPRITVCESGTLEMRAGTRGQVGGASDPVEPVNVC